MTAINIDVVDNDPIVINLQSATPTSFLNLSDTPSSYSGESGKVARVNTNEDGIEFFAVSGTGDVVSNTSSSVDGEITLFSGTGGKTIKRATSTGLLKATSGVLSTATAGTDYLTESSTNTLTNKSFDANGSGNSISNIEVSDFASGVIDTDLTSVSSSDDTIPSAKATKTYADTKITSNSSIIGATKTKITYDSKGLVTSGADATTADISDSTDKRYVTDSQLTTINNISGINTGDQLIFKNIAVSGQNTVSADTTSDTLTLIAGSNITLTTNSTNDSITITATGGSGGMTAAKETKTGANCSGSDGSTNRELILATTPSVVSVVLEGTYLHETLDYNISSNTIIFIKAVYDTDKIEVITFA